MATTERVELGEEVRDEVTGFQGVVVARSEWLFGCVRVAVQPRDTDDDDEPRDKKWFDEPQLEVVGTGMKGRGTPAFSEVDPGDDNAPVSGTGGPSRAYGGRPDDPK